jgi:hypothetical protein
MKLTHKKTENHHVNLNTRAILTFFQQIISFIYGKTSAAVELIFATLQGSMALACQDMYDVEIDDGIIVPVSHFHIILARSGSKKRRYTGSSWRKFIKLNVSWLRCFQSC